MAARKRKSKKASAASYNSTRQRDLVFFLDRSLGRTIVAEALRAEGETVELHDDHFSVTTEDTIWLPSVGERGWVILSKDKAIRHNAIELVALLKSNTHSFILTSANQTGIEMAKSFVSALPQIKSLVRKHQPPFVGTVTAGAHVSVYLTHTQLIEKITG